MSARRLTEVLESKVVTRFVSGESISAKLSPIECYKGRQKIKGYEATILRDILEYFICF